MERLPPLTQEVLLPFMYHVQYVVMGLLHWVIGLELRCLMAPYLGRWETFLGDHLGQQPTGECHNYCEYTLNLVVIPILVHVNRALCSVMWTLIELLPKPFRPTDLARRMVLSFFYQVTLTAMLGENMPRRLDLPPLSLGLGMGECWSSLKFA